MLELNAMYFTGMCQRRGQGGHVPPQILAHQKAPPAAAARRHYCVPPQIFRLWHMPDIYLSAHSEIAPTTLRVSV